MMKDFMKIAELVEQMTYAFEELDEKLNEEEKESASYFDAWTSLYDAQNTLENYPSLKCVKPMEALRKVEEWLNDFNSIDLEPIRAFLLYYGGIEM